MLGDMRAVQVESDCFCDFKQSWLSILNYTKRYKSGWIFGTFKEICLLNTSNLHLRHTASRYHKSYRLTETMAFIESKVGIDCVST